MPTEFDRKRKEALLHHVQDSLIKVSGIQVVNPDLTSEKDAIYFDYFGIHFRVDDRYYVEERAHLGYYSVTCAALLMKAALMNKAGMAVSVQGG
jgi:hypothetical protein